MDFNSQGMSAEAVQAALAEGHQKTPGHLLKVSVVNQDGETVLDTLVDYTKERVAKIVQSMPEPAEASDEPERKMSERLKSKRQKKKRLMKDQENEGREALDEEMRLSGHPQLG